MKNTVKIYRIILSVSLCIISTNLIFGQDLGSTNGLFRSSNPKSNSSGEKKTPTKSKTAAKKTNAGKSSERTSNASTKKKSPAAKKQIVKTNVVPQKNVIITVGQTSGENYANQQYEEALDEGNIARDSREYVRAETAYRRAQNLNPKDFRAVYGLGNIYSDQQRWETSEKFYRNSIALDPTSSDSYIAISFVLTQPIMGKELSTRFIEAEKSARKAIELDPQNPFAYDQLGVSLESNGKIGQETLNAYSKAIKIEPEFALAYAHLGRLLRRTGKIKESTEAYAKSIAFSKDVPTMILVADVLQSQQRYSESEQLLRRSLREDPKNPTALYLLGRALTTRGAFDEAEIILKKSVEISPTSFVSYVLLGSLYSRREDFSAAEKILSDALKVISEFERKNLAQAYEIVGDGYLKKGKKKDAIRAYRQAVALDSQKESVNRKIAEAQL